MQATSRNLREVPKGEAKSQMTGHVRPRCCAPAATTFRRNLDHNTAQIRRAVDSFWPGNRALSPERVSPL